MRTKTFLVTIFVLCFGATLCMAKNAVLTSPAAFVEAGDLSFCTIVNAGEAPVNVSVSIIDHGGVVAATDTFQLSAHYANALGNIAAIGDFFFCTFTVDTKAKNVRAMMTLSNPNVSNKPYATAPAQ